MYGHLCLPLRRAGDDAGSRPHQARIIDEERLATCLFLLRDHCISNKKRQNFLLSFKPFNRIRIDKKQAWNHCSRGTDTAWQ